MRALALITAVLAACAKPPPIENPSPFDEDDPAAAPDDPVEEAEPVADSGYALDDGDDPGDIAQVDLLGVLDRGPGAYAPEIDVEAIVDGGKFRGWKVTRWDVAWKGLRPGDVVVDVNGVVVEKPDDLMALWELLREASEIAIRVELGDGTEEVRRFAVR